MSSLLELNSPKINWCTPALKSYREYLFSTSSIIPFISILLELFHWETLNLGTLFDGLWHGRVDPYFHGQWCLWIRIECTLRMDVENERWACMLRMEVEGAGWGCTLKMHVEDAHEVCMWRMHAKDTHGGCMLRMHAGDGSS